MVRVCLSCNDLQKTGTICDQNSSQMVNDVSEQTQELSCLLTVPLTFSLPRAICSYGFFLLAPNQWLSQSSRFRRPLNVKGSYFWIEVSEGNYDEAGRKTIKLDIKPFNDSPICLATVQPVAIDAVRRMLRLDLGKKLTHSN